MFLPLFWLWTSRRCCPSAQVAFRTRLLSVRFRSRSTLWCSFSFRTALKSQGLAGQWGQHWRRLPLCHSGHRRGGWPRTPRRLGTSGIPVPQRSLPWQLLPRPCSSCWRQTEACRLSCRASHNDRQQVIEQQLVALPSQSSLHPCSILCQRISESLNVPPHQTIAKTLGIPPRTAPTGLLQSPSQLLELESEKPQADPSTSSDSLARAVMVQAQALTD